VKKHIPQGLILLDYKRISTEETRKLSIVLN